MTIPASPGVSFVRRAAALAKTSLTALAWLAGAIVPLFAVVVVTRHLLQTPIVLEPVVLPDALSTMSAVELTHRLSDKIDSVKVAARPAPGQLSWSVDGDMAVPDVEVPMTSTTLAKLLAMLDGMLGRDKYRVTWEVSGRPKASEVNWVVTAHLPGKASHQARFDPSDPDAAIAAIARGILGDIEPLILARALLFDGHCNEAQEIAQTVLRREAQSSFARSATMNFLGLVAQCTTMVPELPSTTPAQYFAIANDIEPNGLAHANLGDVYARRATADTSERQYRAHVDSMRREFVLARSLAPRHPGVFDVWGASYLLVGMPDSAIPHLERAIELEPRASSPYLNLALALESVGQSQQALRRYVEGIARAPGNVQALKQYGHALNKSGEWVAAVNAFGAAAVIDTADYDAKYYLACALYHAGLRDRARPTFESLLTMFVSAPNGYSRESRSALDGKAPSCA